MEKLFNNKWFWRLIEAIFFVVIFTLSVTPLSNFDIWFHVKSGEIILKYGLIHRDVFSYNTAGRVWFAYEWLFQVSVFIISKIAGIEAIKYFISALVVTQIYIICLILRKFLLVEKLMSLALCFWFFALVFEFFTGRPQTLAYTFLLINLFLLLLFYFKNKNLLFLTIPITIFWANLHGSIFLDVLIFLGYAIISLFNYYLDRKDKSLLKKAKIFAVWAAITGALTILPPLGLTQYKLLILFFEHRQLLNSFIDEWTPLSAYPIPFFILSFSTVIVSALFILIHYRRKTLLDCLWVVPLIPFIAVSYIAARNLFLAYIPILLMLGNVLYLARIGKLQLFMKSAVIFLFIVLTGASFLLLQQKKMPVKRYYPVGAAGFVDKYNIKGNMFNEYNYGGYLLYRLYPKQKVFIDGRTDLYLCCEIREISDLENETNLPDAEFKNNVYKLFNRHKISFAILETAKYSMYLRIANILSKDRQWALVYWDDVSQIYVKRDGKNSNIISEFGATAATPYGDTLYPDGTQNKALDEYQRMAKITDSARSTNAIGVIYLKQGKTDEAKNQFEKAISLDPTFEAPFMNLGEMAAKYGDLNSAIRLYKIAQTLYPEDTFIEQRIEELESLYNGN